MSGATDGYGRYAMVDLNNKLHEACCEPHQRQIVIDNPLLFPSSLVVMALKYREAVGIK